MLVPLVLVHWEVAPPPAEARLRLRAKLAWFFIRQVWLQSEQNLHAGSIPGYFGTPEADVFPHFS